MITRDEIISEMGWSAIADCISKDDGLIIRIENIVRLAEAAEREACAKVCDFEVARLHAIDEPRPALAAGICAAAIRARSAK